MGKVPLAQLWANRPSWPLPSARSNQPNRPPLIPSPTETLTYPTPHSLFPTPLALDLDREEPDPLLPRSAPDAVARRRLETTPPRTASPDCLLDAVVSALLLNPPCLDPTRPPP